METQHKSLTVIKQYTQETIAKASELLRQGKLVSFPTETVYGLGANAHNAEACQLIFKTKGRPLTDPLIVHVHSLDHGLSQIDQKDEKVVQLFKTLASKYWPGPLTMVVKANAEVIPSLVTAETGFVGIRMPNHQIALDLIKTSGLPLAAPSANKFGHVSPSKAEHVYSDFHKDSEVLIIDGGACSFGIESTVLKISHSAGTGKYDLLILRRGGVSEQSL
jgi:tRNA threonylcarbamoyl adenosine modification protein (Sua5/YciO/YrdC/YwlC family)